MTTKKMFVALCALFLFSSCSKSHPEQNAIIDGYDEEMLPNDISEIVDSVQYIELQNISEAILLAPQKIEWTKDAIYIQDSNRLLKFSHSGEFLGQISRQGNGHGEYINITSFFITSDGISLLDSERSKLLKFREDGSFSSEDSYPDGSFKLVQNASEFNGRLFCSEYIYNDSHNLYSIIDDIGITVVASTPLTTANVMQRIGKHPYAISNNGIYYVLPFNDVINCYGEGVSLKISTAMTVLSEKQQEDISDFSIMTYASEMEKGDSFLGFTDIFETKRYFVLGCLNLSYTVLDKKSNTCRRYSYMPTDNDHGMPLQNIMSCYGNMLIGLVNNEVNVPSPFSSEKDDSRNMSICLYYMKH